MARLIGMLGSDNSYVRTRGLLLIEANARRDAGYLIDENINQILSYITDPKPNAARQFIQSLPVHPCGAARSGHAGYPLRMRTLVDGIYQQGDSYN